jgi:hypothetical protein
MTTEDCKRKAEIFSELAMLELREGNIGKAKEYLKLADEEIEKMWAMNK